MQRWVLSMLIVALIAGSAAAQQESTRSPGCNSGIAVGDSVTDQAVSAQIARPRLDRRRTFRPAPGVPRPYYYQYHTRPPHYWYYYYSPGPYHGSAYPYGYGYYYDHRGGSYYSYYGPFYQFQYWQR